MQPRVILSLDDGRIVELAHGDLVGRLDACRLRYDDPRISEAHALVSLRGDALRLLGLRGRFSVDGTPRQESTLQAGQRLEFAVGPGCGADVVEVVLPEAVMAIEGPDLPLQVLLGTTSVLTTPVLTLRSGTVADAAAWMAFADDGWWLQRPMSTTRAQLTADGVIDLDGVQLTPRLVSLLSAAMPSTQVQVSSTPLRIVARYQSVHLLREAQLPVVLDGVAARIVSELVVLAGPTAWDVVAREIWSDDVVLPVLRGRWDAQLSRLRARLRAAGIRPELLRADRHGFIELVLGPHDSVVDEV